MPVLFAAQYAYVGAQTLAALREEWGVEAVAAPGPEVDAGLLQLKRVQPGNAMAEGEGMRVKDLPGVSRLKGSGRPNERWGNYRRGVSSRIVYDDEFGDLQSGLPGQGGEDVMPFPGAQISTSSDETLATSADPYPTSSTSSTSSSLPGATTLTTASATFIRALTGALHLHSPPKNNTNAAQTFHKTHILSRHLPLHTLFNFTHPTRDLSRLCAREGFEPPVARLVSESGRLSRSPVFVVGVFSGEEVLGEGVGGSLDEARVRAAAAALRGWYLYSPPGEEVRLPSSVEGWSGGGGKERWRSQMVDIGEIVT